MTAALLLTGGLDHAHDFDALTDAFIELLRNIGVDCTVTRDPDDVAELLPGDFDVLIVNALRWRMTDDRYAHWRSEHAYTTSTATCDAITSFVANGGGLLGNHTAPICFDDWPEWGDVLGGAWVWNRSSHPPAGPVEAHAVGAAATHPVTSGLSPRLALVDEVYGDMDVRPEVQILMTAQRTPGDRDQPVVWAHQYGRGRVVYDGFGHDAASIRDEHHVRLLQQAVRWVTREV